MSTRKKDLRSCAAPAMSLATVVILSACGSGDDPSAGLTDQMTFQNACAALAESAVQGGGVKEAAYVTADGGATAATSWPDHCLVRGAMNQRIGIDGKPYALQFELRLPVTWNQRFYYQGGSGVDGTLFTALGNYSGGGNTSNALLDGYAVVTTDSGHLAETGVANGAFLFGADPQARDEYGDRQLPQVTAAAKTLIAKFYGDGPDWSYFVGCSNGGRQGMIAAQRYPELFDGIVAAAPGFRLAQAAVEVGIHQVQLAATVSPAGADGNPDLSQAMSVAEQLVVKNRILEACDAADGALDGIVGKMSACHPDPIEWVCKNGESDNCLSPAKAEFVQKMFAGGTLASGQPIYASWPYDPGMASMFSVPFRTIFAGEASHIYTTPPTLAPDLMHYSLTADVETEYAKLYAVEAPFARSGVDFTNGESEDLDAFKQRGGKLIIFNGAADLAFSINDVAAYYDRVRARYGDAEAAAVARAFLVPGMGHCSGGNATDEFDAVGALVKWVEQGEAPDQMVASAGPSTDWPGRTRPLCAYPKEAVYKGSGSLEEAESFSCQ